jgi:catechol 2,3-dioxygenase-like lactoylglutathione lyase family enzyme
MAGEETKNWKFHHLGVIVADMEKAVEYYRSLAFVDEMPARPAPAEPPKMVDFAVYGKDVIKGGELQIPRPPNAKPGVPNTWWKVGEITLEVIQPGEGAIKDVNREYLERVGEGIDHIAYTVDAEFFDEEVAKMKAQGLEVILYGMMSNGGGFIYFDTRKVGGIVTELMRVVR